MVTLGGNRTLAEGRAFAAQDEAVLGAGVPLRLGEAFSPMHGQVSASHNEHGHVRYKAVGRLPETGTPWDNAILIPIESVWAVHDALPDAGHGLPLGHLFEGKGSPLPGVSAVVVKPESIAAAYRLRAFWQTATLPDADGRPVNMQGVFTGEVLTELFATLGDMRDIMTGMAYAAQFVALCGVMLVGGMAVSMRKRMLGTLRVLGAPRVSGAQRLVRGQRQHRRGHAGGPAVRLWPFRRCGAAHVPPDRDHALPATYPRRRFLCRRFLRAQLLVRAVPRLYGLSQDGSRRIGGWRIALPGKPTRYFTASALAKRAGTSIHWLRNSHDSENGNTDQTQGFYSDFYQFKEDALDEDNLGSNAHPQAQEMWSCSPSANVTCPDIDGFYDRRAAPFQLNNIIKERPEKAKELFDKLRLFMGELKTM